ncbi:MAG: DsbA family protein [Candidatus Diapherotrites archaeon]
MPKLDKIKVESKVNKFGWLYSLIILFLFALGVFGVLQFFSKPPIDKTELENGQFLGKADAKVVVVVFSDFECPFCSAASPWLKSLVNDFSNVKVVFKHFPLPQHYNARKAAEAAECAGDFGKFWEMHDKLFENQRNLKSSSLQKFASDLGINVDSFNSCLSSGKYSSKVDNDLLFGQSIGVNATPTFFVNGVKYNFSSYDELKSLVASLGA